MQGCSDNKADIYKVKTFELAKELKSLCYANGKERDVKQSAKVIHQLGRAYHEIADELPEGRDKKISLIRSAVLLKAAVVRKPDNVAEVQKDLDELCSCVLQLAGNQNTSVDSLKQLVEASVTKLKNLRRRVKKSALKAFSLAETDQRRASLIENLQKIITEKYKWLMTDIMQFCVEATGPAPCKFALVGMGSLARNEITPFSDFEHIYLLEEGVQNRSDYDNILEYFRWVSVMFQVVVVNFGETIIPHVSLPYLNDPEENNGKGWFFDAHTPRGISFDGMVTFACKFPLGRSATSNKPWDTELIKPVSKMLEYLNRDIDLKNGYHLGDILTKICFVCGDAAIYDQMKIKTIDILQQPRFDENLENQLKEDTDKFNIDKCLGLMFYNSVNIKSIVFRGVTLFIAALGRRFNCKSSSSFDILRELTPSQISQQQSNDFMFALAFACEVRLRVYLKYSCQCDYLDARFEPFHDLLFEVFGKSRIVEFYLFASNLQRLTIKKSEPNESTWCRVILSLVCLRLYNEAIKVIEKVRSRNVFELKETKANISYFEGLCYFKIDQHTSALKCFQHVLDFVGDYDTMRAAILRDMGLCYNKLELNLDAINCYKNALHSNSTDMILRGVQCYLFEVYVYEGIFEMAGNMLSLVLNDNVSEGAQRNVCRYYRGIDKFKESIKYGERNLLQCRQMAYDETSDHETAFALLELARTYIEMENYIEAERAIKMAENISKSKHYVPVNKYQLPAECKAVQGKIYSKKENFLRASDLYKEAYELLPSSKQFQRSKVRVRAEMYFCIGIHNGNNDNNQLALEQLKQAISTCDGYQGNSFLQLVAYAQFNAGICLNKLNRHEEAYNFFETSLEMYSGFHKTEEIDFMIGKCFIGLIKCSFKSNKLVQVVAYFEKGQEYIKIVPLEKRTQLFYNVGLSYQQLNKLENAVKCFEQEIELHSTSDPDKEVAMFIASCHLQIGQCYLQMKLHAKAIQSSNTAIKLWKKIDHPSANLAIKMCYGIIALANL